MAQYDTTWFEKGLAELEITLNEKQIEQFLTYYELLGLKSSVRLSMPTQ